MGIYNRYRINRFYYIQYHILSMVMEKGDRTMNCCNRPMQEVLTQHANPLRDTCYVTHYRCQECKGTRIKLHRPY